MKNARNQSRSDAELLSRVSKEPEAFAEFYRRHVAVILAFVDRQIHDPHASFDITAEVFASALEAVGQFDPNRGSARNWLFGIARNATIDAQRAAQARDDVRRRLAMAPVELDDDGLERVKRRRSVQASPHCSHCSNRSLRMRSRRCRLESSTNVTMRRSAKGSACRRP